MQNGTHPNAPKWVGTGVAVAIHKSQIAEHGGTDGVRDFGLLESAMARPRFLYDYSEPKPDLASLAASYAFGICKNHAFVDGNKRVALAVTRTFLLRNGFRLAANQAEKAVAFRMLAAGELTESELADWIRRRLTGPISES